MISKLIGDIGGIYEKGSEAAIAGWEVTTVQWRELFSYHESLKYLENHLEALDLSESWKDTLKPFRQLRWFLATSPLPPRDLHGSLKDDPALLLQHKIKSTTATVADEIMKRYAPPLLQSLGCILSQNENPMWIAFKETLANDVLNTAVYAPDVQQPASANTVAATADVIEEAASDHGRLEILNDVLESDTSVAPCKVIKKERVCFLSRENSLEIRFRDYVTKQVGTIMDCTVLRPGEMKGMSTFDRLVLFGSPHKTAYTNIDFIIRAPRASRPCIYMPEIFRREKTTLQEAFKGSPHGPDSPRLTAPKIKKHVFENDGHISLSAHEYHKPSEISWDEIYPRELALRKNLDNSSADSEEEPVEAIALLLSANQAVYLKKDGKTWKIIQGRSDQGWFCADVEHVRSLDVGIGEILLFQSEGGGDMTAVVADILLGSKREECRKLQKLWKEKLMDKKRIHGAAEVAEELHRFGMDRQMASSNNVIRWCGMDNIAPQTDGNLLIILKYCGLQSKSNEIETATDAIRSAHLTAGKKLRDILLRQMNNQSLAELYENEFQDFGGSREIPTTKRAFFVEAIISGTVMVSPQKLNRPFSSK